MASLTIRELCKKFGNHQAVDHVSLDIKDGEFLVIVGPSGCGKTTLLRMIAGLEIPDQGEIYVGDRFINKVPPKDRDVAMVFQDYALYAHMDVYNNLAFGLRMRKTDRQETDQRVREAAAMMGIEGLLRRRPRQLSGGERQRVALGRALVRRPILFLMDEPLSNLDALLRVRMRTELIRLHQEVKTTTVYVTHDQVEAMTMGSLIAVINRGKLQQLGSPNEIYDQPANRFVAGFFGSPPMNFVPGFIDWANGRALFRSEDQSIELLLTGEAGHQKPDTPGNEQKVLLGIRPEGIYLRSQPTQVDGTERPVGEAQIEVLEPLGYECIVYTNIGEHSLAVRAECEEQLALGQRVSVFFDQRRLHLFDPVTETALSTVRERGQATT